MKKVFRKAVTAFRWGVVALCAVVLTVSGASSAQRLFEAYQAPAGPPDSAEDLAQLLPGPPSPDQLPENMTPSGKPNCEPSAYLSTPVLTDSNNNQCRVYGGGQQKMLATVRSLGADNKASIRPTAFRVSSHLGLQFTLVGAKPSGTS